MPHHGFQKTCHHKVTYRRFTCSKVEILFTDSFQAALFSFADLRKNRSFLLAEIPFFSLSQQKPKEPLEKTSEKNHYFGTCKPATSNQ